MTASHQPSGSLTTDKPLGMWRAGLAGGVTAIICCVGPTVLALIGVLSAASAFTLATGLYDQWHWVFSLAGLVVTAGLIWWALRRRRACTLPGVKKAWKRIAGALLIGLGTYLALYWITTWLGRLAS
ncbi:hypothetical protein [Specibacter cremeus]|uniref:hypothetical protein n=1 Tax=Specibacter cremeus TaxID=1629051 RepID=UPI000F7988F7|nr:hypothetical protein [Specibacter cremeus]